MVSIFSPFIYYFNRINWNIIFFIQATRKLMYRYKLLLTRVYRKTYTKKIKSFYYNSELTFSKSVSINYRYILKFNETSK